MRILPDVNLLLACAWDSHAQHRSARAWLNRQKSIFTCPFTELGFLRVSLTPGFRAPLALAQEVLADLKERAGSQFLVADLPAAELPVFATHAEATDAYLVAFAQKHGLRLATLDDALCRKDWAQEIAFNPLAQSR